MVVRTATMFSLEKVNWQKKTGGVTGADRGEGAQIFIEVDQE